ncbi:hypothetical protein LQZ19_05275 [Treponema primitia]|uniref:hypothetical protein n=1 Tax=Treponema primitia TaxID=88058 RepID=UPI00397F0500
MSKTTESLRRRLSEYLEAKGIIPDEYGKIKCLWHDDDHPSCQVNEEYLYCHTCHKSGDIYATAAALLGVSHDKEHFREIAADVENTLGIEPWKPQRRKPGEPKSIIKLSKSAMYRSLLLREFAAALDNGDMEAAYHKATLLYALSMMPDAVKPAENVTKQRETVADKMAAWGRR